LLGSLSVYEYTRLSPSNVYKDHYQPYTLRATRGSGAAADTRPGDVGAVNRSQLNKYFLAGNTFLEQGKTTDAIRCFLQVRKQNLEQGTHILEDDTDYYLGMSYLLNKQISLALPLFEKIHADPSHLYHDKVSRWFLLQLHLL
jgi:hypothetical protein